MLIQFLPALIAAVAMAAEIPHGERLPVLKGAFLTGRDAVLPEASAGRIALLAVGFTYQSRFAVEAWVGRFRADFGQDRQVTFFEIPVISGMAQMGKWFIDSGMRRGTPRADQENVITVYGAGKWKKWLGFREPDAAYLVLLDSNGIVRWRSNAPFSEANYKSLSDATEALRHP